MTKNRSTFFVKRFRESRGFTFEDNIINYNRESSIFRYVDWKHVLIVPSLLKVIVICVMLVDLLAYIKNLMAVESRVIIALCTVKLDNFRFQLKFVFLDF